MSRIQPAKIKCAQFPFSQFVCVLICRMYRVPWRRQRKKKCLAKNDKMKRLYKILSCVCACACVHIIWFVSLFFSLVLIFIPFHSSFWFLFLFWIVNCVCFFPAASLQLAGAYTIQCKYKYIGIDVSTLLKKEKKYRKENRPNCTRFACMIDAILNAMFFFGAKHSVNISFFT